MLKIARVVPEISCRTDTHTQTYSPQYFAAAPVGGVIRKRTCAQKKKVRVIVRGGSTQGERESTLGRLCGTGGFEASSERIRK